MLTLCTELPPPPQQYIKYKQLNIFMVKIANLTVHFDGNQFSLFLDSTGIHVLYISGKIIFNKMVYNLIKLKDINFEFK